MKSFKDVKDIILSAATDHISIKYTDFGDAFQMENDWDNRTYPMFYLIPDSTNIINDNNYNIRNIEYNFQIIIGTKLSNDKSNADFIISENHNILFEIIYKLSQLNLNISIDRIDLFLEQFDQSLAGIGAFIKVNIPFEINICSLSPFKTL